MSMIGFSISAPQFHPFPNSDVAGKYLPSRCVKTKSTASRGLAGIRAQTSVRLLGRRREAGRPPVASKNIRNDARHSGFKSSDGKTDSNPAFRDSVDL